MSGGRDATGGASGRAGRRPFSRARELLGAWPAALGGARAACLRFLARRDALLGMNARNLDYVFPCNAHAHFPLVDDKLEAKRLLEGGGVAVARTLAVVEGFSQLDALDDVLEAHPEFVIKPASGSGGKGVLVAAESGPLGIRTVSGRRVPRSEVRRHLVEILYGTFSSGRADRAFFEERLHPHPFFAAYGRTGLADIRVIVHQGRPVLSMLRLPTSGSSGTANLHQGGIGVGVDIDTGRTLRAVCRGIALTRHPDNALPLVGAQVPHWARIVATARAAAALFPLGYLGVDVVLDARGRALILELNARPGLQIQNATGTGLRGRLEALDAPARGIVDTTGRSAATISDAADEAEELRA